MFGWLFLASGLLAVAWLLVWRMKSPPALRGSANGLLGRLSPNLLAHLRDHDMVSIPAGPFTLGSTSGRADELPIQEVTLAAYAIDRYEVTNAQYARFLKATGQAVPRYWMDGEYPPGLADYPVVGVSWQAAADYCLWAGKRLPSEAEWEKACRGVDERTYPWGNEWLPQAANAVETCRIPGSQSIDALWLVLETSPAPGQIGLRPVGSYTGGASPFGVMDMAGNAAEWVQDWYNANAYAALPGENPLSNRPQADHALRGSSWWINPGGDDRGSGETAAFASRCAARSHSNTKDDIRTGFRCAQ